MKKFNIFILLSSIILNSGQYFAADTTNDLSTQINGTLEQLNNAFDIKEQNKLCRQLIYLRQQAVHDGEPQLAQQINRKLNEIIIKRNEAKKENTPSRKTRQRSSAFSVKNTQSATAPQILQSSEVGKGSDTPNPH